MYLDAPLHLVSAAVSDLVRRPSNLKQALWNYLDSRTLAFGAGRIPTRTIFEIAPNAKSQEVRLQNFFEGPPYQLAMEPNVETGSVSAREATTLVSLVAMTKGRLIIEFGTAFGDTALLFALNTPDDSVILSNDWPERPEAGVKIKACPKVKQVFAKTQEWNLDEYRGQADLVFVDAAHDYPNVAADSEKALTLVAPGGIVCWHDYRHGYRHDVVRALDQLGDRLPLAHIKYTSIVVYQRQAD